MKDIKDQLVRLGAQRPDLRKHLRPILRSIEAASVPREVMEIKRYALSQGLPESLIKVTYEKPRPMTRKDSRLVRRWALENDKMVPERWKFFVRTTSPRLDHEWDYYYPTLGQWTGVAGPGLGEAGQGPRYIKQHLDKLADAYSKRASRNVGAGGWHDLAKERFRVDDQVVQVNILPDGRVEVEDVAGSMIWDDIDMAIRGEPNSEIQRWLQKQKRELRLSASGRRSRSEIMPYVASVFAGLMRHGGSLFETMGRIRYDEKGGGSFVVGETQVELPTGVKFTLGVSIVDTDDPDNMFGGDVYMSGPGGLYDAKSVGRARSLVDVKEQLIDLGKELGKRMYRKTSKRARRGQFTDLVVASQKLFDRYGYYTVIGDGRGNSDTLQVFSGGPAFGVPDKESLFVKFKAAGDDLIKVLITQDGTYLKSWTEPADTFPKPVAEKVYQTVSRLF